MKERILYGWNFQRILFIAVGIFVIVQSSIDYLLPGIFIGSYFTAMGLFRFGCASGNCSIDYSTPIKNKKEIH